MARAPFPDISGDLDGRPRHILPPAQADRPEPTDEEVEANTAKLQERHPAVSRAKASKAAAPAKPERHTQLQINIPVSLQKQLNVRAATDGCTKTHLVLQALADAGFDIDPAFLATDRRRS